MREIKFRGKDIIGCEFVYGDLIHGVGSKAGKCFILPLEINLAYVKNCDPLDGVEVDTETIEQFTGLKDKNGKEIYEGDILKGGIYKSYVVKWDDEENGFNVNYHALHYEIIGNIHNNPELLK